MERVIMDVSVCSYTSLKPYVPIGHILMIKVKGTLSRLWHRKSRVYNYMKYWHDVYNTQF